MGWKFGQGIGPRLSLRQRKLQDLQASTGLDKTSDDVQVDETDVEANKHKYPRRDTPIIAFSRKDNFHGLGYSPGMSLNESLGVKSDNRKSSGPNISGMYACRNASSYR